ncbi:hypothetical protein FHR81_002823 [Actinoalloteichus hoggarensis]|uniref:Uncharacterized protein n=1 Tax=Actinoalloteichus hoggarensis TaxID=1470176 RepID=A0A221VY52_9PSEU|nr:hypothetical protein AHOG_03805 [Actinoalloteichus hoggarensis]MBB5921783.1 hypothetical protein [Actinoalloteichus hoggarensis]
MTPKARVVVIASLGVLVLAVITYVISERIEPMRPTMSEEAVGGRVDSRIEAVIAALSSSPTLEANMGGSYPCLDPTDGGPKIGSSSRRSTGFGACRSTRMRL